MNGSSGTTDDSTVELSVVIPVYNAADCLDELFERLTAVLEDVCPDYEIILVDDASPDESWKVMKALREREPRIRLIQHMRNFGQHKAILCGMAYARGKLVATMDDDLQHPPEELPKLLDAIRTQDRIDVVMGAYVLKQHSWFRNLGTKTINAVTSHVFNKDSDLKLTSFRIMRRAIVRELMKYEIDCPRIGQLLLLTTNRIANVPVRHDAREHGRSGYTLRRLVANALDNILSNSSLPLQIVSYMGFACSFLSVVLGMYYLYKYLFVGISMPGWTTIILLMLMFFGILFFSLGIIGEYLIRILREAKRSPRSAVREEEV